MWICGFDLDSEFKRLFGLMRELGLLAMTVTIIWVDVSQWWNGWVRCFLFGSNVILANVWIELYGLIENKLRLVSIVFLQEWTTGDKRGLSLGAWWPSLPWHRHCYKPSMFWTMNWCHGLGRRSFSKNNMYYSRYVWKWKSKWSFTCCNIYHQ